MNFRSCGPPGRIFADNRDAAGRLQASRAPSTCGDSAAPKSPETRGDRCVELEKKDDGDGEVGRDEAKQETTGVEELEDDDAAARCPRYVLGHGILEEACPRCISPAGVE